VRCGGRRGDAAEAGRELYAALRAFDAQPRVGRIFALVRSEGEGTSGGGRYWIAALDGALRAREEPQESPILRNSGLVLQQSGRCCKILSTASESVAGSPRSVGHLLWAAGRATNSRSRRGMLRAPHFRLNLLLRFCVNIPYFAFLVAT
jgi:hypothetical protein